MNVNDVSGELIKIESRAEVIADTAILVAHILEGTSDNDQSTLQVDTPQLNSQQERVIDAVEDALDFEVQEEIDAFTYGLRLGLIVRGLVDISGTTPTGSDPS